jgi:acyl-CoA thioester hydrolase
MEIFTMPVQIRWSDLDPNFHLRHSVYYDWGAQCRIDFLSQNGLTPALMQQLQFGPIIFREEAVFRKEIKYGDTVQLNLKLMKGKRDYSRWTIAHEITKNGSVLCAVVAVDGAWLNVQERKLFTPHSEVTRVFQQMPLAENFEWLA